MRLFKYLALCVFISTTHGASTFLKIAEANEFCTSAAPNVCLTCEEVDII